MNEVFPEKEQLPAIRTFFICGYTHHESLCAPITEGGNPEALQVDQQCPDIQYTRLNPQVQAVNLLL